MAGVVLEDLTKRYDGGGALAVNNLNLDIKDGEFVCLVGPSGCGKTTALRMIAGLEEITSGEVRIGDRVVNNLPPRDRDIAMVFQSYALYPHMSVRDNMAFGLQLRKTPKAEIDKAVDRGSAHPRSRALPRPQAGPAVRRPAATRRTRTRDRSRARGVPDGRAALEPRREVACPDARRDRAHAHPPRGHDDLRHARPGRGDDHGRPHRGDQRGRAAAGGQSEGAVRAPSEPVRRRLHRVAVDELHRPQGLPGRRRRPAHRRGSRDATGRHPVGAAAQPGSGHGEPLGSGRSISISGR